MFPKGIVASIQPKWCGKETIAAIACECAKYAVALRIEGIENIKAVAEEIEGIYNIPIIGLVKQRENALNTLITPTCNDAFDVIDAGASYVAMELTDRVPTDRIKSVIEAKIQVISDVADYAHAETAKNLGCVAITTALSGYINKQTHPFVDPDYRLVKQCSFLDLPVIAEGRYWEQEQIDYARGIGAYAVCIGTAIHEPKHIVNRAVLHFSGFWERHSKNGFVELV